MINEAIKEYRDNNAQLAEKYKDRIAELKAVAERDLLLYLDNSIRLYIIGPPRNFSVSVLDIKVDLHDALIRGIFYVEYLLNKHYYPGFKGDNLSFLTGNYYIREGNEHIEVSGCPSLVQKIREQYGPDFIVSFRETANSCGHLRVEAIIT